MQADQNIISNITCFETFQTIGANILDDMICTLKGPLGTESICSGDSGSPLMVKEGRIIACQKGITYLYIENIDFPFNSFRWQQQQVYSGRFDLIFNGEMFGRLPGCFHQDNFLPGLDKSSNNRHRLTYLSLNLNAIWALRF